jgi:hypothetical protein
MTTKDFYRRRAAHIEAGNRAAGWVLIVGCTLAAGAAFCFLLSALNA